MTTYMRKARHSSFIDDPEIDFKCKNERNNWQVTNKEQKRYRIHEHKIGSKHPFHVEVPNEKAEAAIKAIRRELADYAVYTGIYCKTTFSYDKKSTTLTYIVTHDGIRYLKDE